MEPRAILPINLYRYGDCQKTENPKCQRSRSPLKFKTERPFHHDVSSVDFQNHNEEGRSQRCAWKANYCGKMLLHHFFDPFVFPYHSVKRTAKKSRAKHTCADQGKPSRDKLEYKFVLKDAQPRLTAMDIAHGATVEINR